MKNIKIKDIINLTKGTLIQGNPELECIEFSKDTRTIKGGEIYIGIKGENFDGNNFWKEALTQGADAVIVQDINFKEEELKEFKNKTIIKVENTLEVLYKIAKCIKSAELIAYEDLGAEALRKLYVEDMPLVVIIDSEIGFYSLLR